MRIHSLLAALLLALHAAADPFPLDAPGLPETADADRNDPVLDAARFWRLGGTYVYGAQDKFKIAGFSPVDMLDFLTASTLHPVVRFSCSDVPTYLEDHLTKLLVDAKDPVQKLQALAILLSVEAPSSVDKQWAALVSLKGLKREEALWLPLLDDMEKRFAEERILAEIKKDRWEGRFDDSTRGTYWAIRAAGVRQFGSAIDRLKDLSRHENLYASLAAERSLEDFPGQSGDDGLAWCMTGWRYNAANHAGAELLKRNPALLAETLLKAEIPKDFRWEAGLLLAKCDRTEAVPLLSETVAGRAIVDTEMFEQIARLATREQLVLVEALPGKVREEQRAAATAVLERVRARFKAEDDAKPK